MMAWVIFFFINFHFNHFYIFPTLQTLEAAMLYSNFIGSTFEMYINEISHILVKSINWKNFLLPPPD